MILPSAILGVQLLGHPEAPLTNERTVNHVFRENKHARPSSLT